MALVGSGCPRGSVPRLPGEPAPCMLKIHMPNGVITCNVGTVSYLDYYHTHRDVNGSYMILLRQQGEKGLMHSIQARLSI